MKSLVVLILLVCIIVPLLLLLTLLEFDTNHLKHDFSHQQLSHLKTDHERWQALMSQSVEYHLYEREIVNDCDIHRISLKYNPHCGQDSTLAPKHIKQLLIVSVQRSGTHYFWEMLNRLGIDVHHEGVGPDGAVSWLYAVNSHYNSTPPVEDIGHGYVINNPLPLDKNRFRRIFHQVRHPLRVIGTLLRCCGKWDAIWEWIHRLRGFNDITIQDTPLKRAMMLYWLWNKQIERYADLRYRSEDTSPYSVCQWAGFGERCHSLSVPYRNEDHHPVKKKTNNLTTSTDRTNMNTIDWNDLELEDSALTFQIKTMCIEYGYSLNPDRIPQPPQTKYFTA